MQPVTLPNAASILGIAAPTGNGSGVGSATDDSNNAGDLFSQLLGGFDLGAGQDQSAPTPFSGVPDLLANSNANLLSAQDIAAAGARQTTSQLAQLLQQPISPQQAGELAAKLDALAATGDHNSQLQQQLKDQLAQLAQASQPKTVAEIIQALPVVKEADAAASQGLAAVSGSNQAASRSSIIQRALQLLHGSLSRAAANASDEEAQHAQNEDAAQAFSVADTSDPNLLSLQAASFRPADGAPAAASPAKEDSEPKHDARTHTDIIPVNQQVLVPQWVAAIAPATPASDTAPDLDTLIPPLNNGPKTAAALPEVSLPKVNLQPVEQAKSAAFANALAEGEVAAEAAKKQDVLAAAKDSQDVSAAPAQGVSGTHGQVATQTANAVQAPAATLPPHMLNHAPVTEQVHVALTRAKESGIDHITIQLDPGHLGRVEVKFHTNSDGQTQISFIADKAETFDALSRDARALEHSLQEAGIKADAGSMQFNLRQPPQPQLNTNLSGGQQGQDNQPQARNDEDDTDKKITVAGLSDLTRHYTINVRDGVDIHA